MIRKITLKDNAAMEDIIKSTMTEFGAAGPGFSINDAEVSQMFENYSSNRHAYFVIEKDHQVLGGAGIAPLAGGDETICELRKMYFRPELRNLGLGQKLMDHCLAEARRMGYKQCYLETLTSMAGADKLYAKNGFRPLSKPLGNTGHFSCDKFYLKDLE